MKEIAADFKRRGVKNTRGTDFTINTISNMLSNRRYIGEYKYRDIVIPDGIPAIVDKALFDRVQQQIEKNKKAPARYKADADYILTTKLYCGKCKSFMVGESGTSRNATTYRYYKCITAKRKKGCDKKAVKKDWIEEIVINQIKKIIFDDALMEAIADRVYQLQDQENSTVPLLKKQLAETEKGIENVLNAIEQGIITPSTKHRLQELEQRKQDLQIEIAKENIKKPIITKEQILFWLHRFRNIDTDNVKHRKRLVDSFVNSIVLYDDRIEFYFNYKEGAKTLTLEELSKSSDLLNSAPPNKRLSRCGRRLFIFIYRFFIDLNSVLHPNLPRTFQPLFQMIRNRPCPHCFHSFREAARKTRRQRFHRHLCPANRRRHSRAYTPKDCLSTASLILCCS